MCVFNKNAHEVYQDVDRFSEFINKENTFVSAVTNELFLASELTLKGKSASIFKVNQNIFFINLDQFIWPKFH